LFANTATHLAANDEIVMKKYICLLLGVTILAACEKKETNVTNPPAEKKESNTTIINESPAKKP